jgi:HEAT repeat protein
MKNITRRCFAIVLGLSFAAFAIPAHAAKKTEDQLIAELSSPEEKLVYNAMADLERQFPTSTKYHPKLKELLSDSRERVRTKAGRVLGAVHAEMSADDIKSVVKQLKSTNTKAEKEAGLKTLRDLGSKAKSTVSDITPLLKDADVGIKRDACRTLAVIADKSVVSEIEPLLKDSDPKVQKDAQDAIFKLKEKN